MRGRVKFFDHERGVGAITPADGSDDVPVYIGAVERSGLVALLAGQDVDFTKAPWDCGVRAVDIIIR